MKLNIEELKERFKLLGVVTVITDKETNTNVDTPISFTGFKNRCSIHKYGKSHKIVFLGHPKQNLFGFYVMYAADAVVLKEAYQMFLNVINKNDISDYENNDLQWGNAGIPLGYGNIRTTENSFVI